MIHALIKSLYFGLQSSPLECESFDTLSHVAYVGDVKLKLARSLQKICGLKKRIVLLVPVFYFKYESSALS